MMTKSKLKICSLESRRGDDMKRMIERFGGDATIAPSMREVPIEEHAEAFTFGEQLLAGKIDIVIFMTGVGARYLVDTLSTRHSQEEILAALAKCVLIVRGPKPTAVLREWKLKRISSKVNFTSAAVKGSPSCHCTPAAKWKV